MTGTELEEKTMGRPYTAISPAIPALRWPSACARGQRLRAMGQE